MLNAIVQHLFVRVGVEDLRVTTVLGVCRVEQMADVNVRIRLHRIKWVFRLDPLLEEGKVELISFLRRWFW